MATRVDTNTMSIAAGAAMPRYSRCKITAAGAVPAGAGEAFSGVNEHTVFADDVGEKVTLRAPGSGSTMVYIADGAIPAFSEVYSGADGKVSLTVSGLPILITLDEALADGAEIECMPLFGG